MLIDNIERIIRTTPGLTATQIARQLYGNSGYGERVRAVCQALHKLGRIERTGMGGPGDPFRFNPPADATISSSLSGKELSPSELRAAGSGNLGRPLIGSREWTAIQSRHKKRQSAS